MINFIVIVNVKNNLNFNEMGVGGLGKELKDLIDRVFLSRALPLEFAEKYGMKHAKGVLLYGSPGTGKTLIARSIARMLGTKKIKYVNGPELFNKFVGNSELNLRALFRGAEKEWRQKGKESDLHIIIFDEIDALFKKRGTTRSGTGIEDSLVNQMLTKLDGLEQIGNILIIGTTNRKDLLDEALLRKGRLGIHIQICLPDEKGRREIMDIHTKNLRENNLLDPDVDLDEWAKTAVNFTGADIEGWIDEARYITNTRNFASKEKETVFKSDSEDLAVITQDDLREALNKVTPAFGVSREKLMPYLAYPFVPYNRHLA